MPADKVVAAAVREASARGDRRVGTDYLALGLLCVAPEHVRDAFGVSLDAARAALEELDRAALASVGIRLDVDEPAAGVVALERPVLTSGARAVLQDAMRLAVRTRSGRPGPEHIALALLDTTSPDACAQLLEALQVDLRTARERLHPMVSEKAV